MEKTSCILLSVTNSSLAGSLLGYRGREYLLFIKELFITLRFIPWFIDSDFQSPMGWVHSNPVCLSYVPSWRVYNICDLHLPGALLENITAFGLHISTIYLWSSSSFHIRYRGCAKRKGFFCNVLARYGFLAFRKKKKKDNWLTELLKFPKIHILDLNGVIHSENWMSSCASGALLSVAV